MSALQTELSRLKAAAEASTSGRQTLQAALDRKTAELDQALTENKALFERNLALTSQLSEQRSRIDELESHVCVLPAPVPVPVPPAGAVQRVCVPFLSLCALPLVCVRVQCTAAEPPVAPKIPLN